jgi:hypothetical protein
VKAVSIAFKLIRPLITLIESVDADIKAAKADDGKVSPAEIAAIVAGNIEALVVAIVGVFASEAR